MATKTKKPKKRVSAKTMCRKTLGTPGINKRTGQLLKGWKYVNGVPKKVTATTKKSSGKKGLGATCVRPNGDGSSTTYTSHGGNNPCPHGGRVRAERITLKPAGTTFGLGKAKPKRKTAKQSAAQKAFAVNAKKAAALVKSGKAKNIKSAWAQLKK